MSGTARLIREWETNSFFTGQPITKRHYAVNPAFDGADHLVVSVIEESAFHGKPDLAVFKANAQGHEVEFEGLLPEDLDLSLRNTTDPVAALNALDYEVVTDNE